MPTPTRTKHIDTRYHFIRELIKLGIVDLVHIPRLDNLADLFTHPVGPKTHEQLVPQVLNEQKACLIMDINKSNEPRSDITQANNQITTDLKPIESGTDLSNMGKAYRIQAHVSRPNPSTYIDDCKHIVQATYQMASDAIHKVEGLCYNIPQLVT